MDQLYVVLYTLNKVYLFFSGLEMAYSSEVSEK